MSMNHTASPGKLLRSSLRRLSRMLPSGMRQQMKDRLRRFLLPEDPATLPNPYVPGVRAAAGRLLPDVTDLGMNIVGYIQSEIGIGESARCCARAARAAGLPFAMHDFQAGNEARAADRTWAPYLGGPPLPGVNVCHINADQLPLAYATLGKEFFEQRYTIGFWHWELPEFPDRWLDSFALVDEVWTSSRFVADAVSRKSPVPVLRMPHAIDFDVNPQVRRADLGLPADRFLFLMMYDTHSFQERKNPQAAIEAFRRAFPSPRDVCLVVKINHPRSYPADVQRLRASMAGAPGVHLIDRTMTRQEVYDLESLCDCFVSLHRSEGFGLGLAEAMFLGKPVIGTHWSGNLDFMTVTNSCPVGYELVALKEDVGPYEKGQLWADADVEEAAWHMKRLVEDAARCRAIGARGRETIRTWFSPAVVGQMYRARLAVIRRMIDATPEASGAASARRSR
jgi:glycosyltransferase involved in cell wall biosynthesis